MSPEGRQSSPSIRDALRPLAHGLRRARHRIHVEHEVFRARRAEADLAIFHDFVSPPAGGASQALQALVDELNRRGVRVETNAIPSQTRAVLFNSFNFDVERLERFVRLAPRARRIHRVGAVTTLYRGFDDGTDAHVADVNRRLAHATLAISQATIDMYRRIGIDLVRPRVIHNPCDPRIFHAGGRIPFSRDRKIRLICASWSDNPRKGGPTYRWLEQHLDWERFEFTFVGNSSERFERVRTLPPMPSAALAKELRAHDIFVTATENDAYSNALVEALSCGIPAIYLDSGGSHEVVKDAGFGFRSREEIPVLIDRLIDEYEERQARISLPSLREIVDAYLDLLGLHEFVTGADGHGEIGG